jgi:hypothetical protein
VDVLGDERHFLDDILLAAKFQKSFLKLLVGPLERRQRARTPGFAVGVTPRGIFAVNLPVQLMDPRNEFAERAQVRVAAVHFLF